VFALSICLRPLALLAAAMHALAHEGSAEETVQLACILLLVLGVHEFVTWSESNESDEVMMQNNIDPNKHVDGAAG